MLNYYYIENEKDTILYLHGYSSNNKSMFHIYNYFRKKGYGILAPDSRGHGESPGKIYEFEKTIKDLNNLVNEFNIKYIVGHSMGALQSIILAKNRSVKKVFPIASPYEYSVETLGQSLLESLAKIQKADKKFKDWIGSIFPDNLKLTPYQSSKIYPIQGRTDEIVTFHHFKSIVKQFNIKRNNTLIVDSGHIFILINSNVRKWIEKKLLV
jgi:pimeloyl-ACP methyl ester carboxylesterase